MRRRYEQVALRQAFRILAMLGPRQQDFRRSGAQLQDPSILQPVAALLRIAAVNIGRTQTALGVFYRQLAARTGKAKAVTAIARKLAILFYRRCDSV